MGGSGGAAGWVIGVEGWSVAEDGKILSGGSEGGSLSDGEERALLEPGKSAVVWAVEVEGRNSVSSVKVNFELSICSVLGRKYGLIRATFTITFLLLIVRSSTLCSPLRARMV